MKITFYKNLNSIFIKKVEINLKFGVGFSIFKVLKILIFANKRIFFTKKNYEKKKFH